MAAEAQAEGEPAQVSQRAAWEADPTWVDDLPTVKVSRPKGSFFQLDCSATVGLHPAAVFEAMCDTGNQRIFRNTQGVRNRVVVEDSATRKVVELEMLAAWKFMFLAGEFGVHVRLTQDKVNHKLHFELAKPGFMKKFCGVWTVDPVPVPPSAVKIPGRPATASGKPGLRALGRLTSTSAANASQHQPRPTDILELALQVADVDESKEGARDDQDLAVLPSSSCASSPWYGRGTRVASRVTFSQEVQPAINPPPIFAHYLRGIAAKSIIEAMCDIQIEAARIRHGIPETAPNVQEELLRRGFTSACIMFREDKSGKVKGLQSLPSFGAKRVGLRDWSVADGKKASAARRLKNLSDKDKWSISKTLQEHLRAECPTVRISSH